MQEPGVEQQLHDLRNAACAMQVGRDIFTRRLQVAQHGDALADAFEVVNGPRHFGGMRDGEEMQHGVGGTAGGHDDRNGVFDGCARDDVARPQVAPDRIDEHPRRLGGRDHLFIVFIGHRAGIRQAHAHGFERGAHRVGRVHAAPGA
ncbi:hypothetical protein G6F68_018534 [Rhizopus microsporus]|nr:hypothetical protein G6F68_018534 [Rhizopus microsporus]